MGATTTDTLSVSAKGGVAENWDVTSSAPGIVTAAKSGSSVILTATGNGTGTATITVMSTDGSNKKATCKVKVQNPASNLTLGIPGGRSSNLSRGKTLQLKTVLGTDLGKLDASAKKLKWTSSNPEKATVSASGKVKALSNNGSVVITATTTDGSGISASIQIGLVADVLKLDFNYQNIELREGYYTCIKPVKLSVKIKDVYGSFYYDDFVFNVSGNGGVGIAPHYTNGKFDGSYEVVANKKGTYTVTISCKTGCKGKATIKVKVK